ncbi:MAG: transcriptional regulator [Solirubrobacterales bacterium]|nr:transcriptional regulator [Solirubrobacterales bacterium]
MEAFDALRAISNGARADDLESETLEFKQAADEEGETIRALLDAAICLANARGGAIVLGLADNVAGPSGFVGTTIDPYQVRKRLHELSEPPLVVTAFDHEHSGKRLVIVGVSEGMEMVSDTRGRASRRIGKECRPLTISQAAALQDDRRRFDWSAEVSDRDPDSVQAPAVDASRTMLGRFEDERRALAQATTEDLLGDLGVIRDGRLVRAGEILFIGSSERPPIVYVFRDTPGGEAIDEYRDAVPGLIAYREVIARIQRNSSPTTITLPDGQQLVLHDFPLLAIREALSNALLHRDYRQPEPVSVDHSPNVLSFVSPGPLVPGVTPENILHAPSKPRNAQLMRVARGLGLAEELSRGVDRMYREMLKLGKQPPHITEDAPFSVRVELTGGAPNQVIARFVAGLPVAAQEDVDVMLVLFALTQRSMVSASELAPLLQRSENATQAVLQRMSDPEIEMLAPQSRKGGTAWQLSQRALAELRTALAYRTVTQDEMDRKIIEYVREKRTIDNRTLRIFFDLDVNGAAYRLRTLVGAQILEKLGTQERGPGIQYGPGVNFPAEGQSE